MQMQVNITTQVNGASIRREMYNGREHIVIPSYTLPANVIMNGGLYPQSEIDAHYEKLEGTLAPLGHPQVNGKFVSAFSPEGINISYIGAWNRNVKKAGDRVSVEKWIDVEFAKNSEKGPKLLERIEAIERGDAVDPIHTSIAVFLNREPAVNARGYEWIARIKSVDHDAILLDEIGAATPEQGVGLMVNADQAQPYNPDQADPAADDKSLIAWVKQFFTTNQARPDQPKKEGLMALTPEEKAELVKDFGEVVANKVQPLATELETLKTTVGTIQANQQTLSDSLTANQRAEEQKKRDAVAAHFKLSKEGAAALTGNALDDLYKQVGDAPGLLTGNASQKPQTGAPDPAEHFGGAK